MEESCLKTSNFSRLSRPNETPVSSRVRGRCTKWKKGTFLLWDVRVRRLTPNEIFRNLELALRWIGKIYGVVVACVDTDKNRDKEQNFDRLFLSTSNESTYLLNSFQSLPFNYEKARRDNGKGDQRFESCEKICLQIFLINNSATTKRRNFDGLCTRAPPFSSLNL